MATDDQNRTKCRHSGRENYSMTCHRFYGLRRQKSWASLDAVMKGNNLPNDTAGCSFSPGGATQPSSPGDSTTDSSTANSANGTASPPHDAKAEGSLWCHERGASVFDSITTLFAVVPRFNPDELEDVYAPDFILDFDYPDHTLACCTLLPAAEPDEERFLAGYELAPESAARGQNVLAAEIPAVVVDGLPLTEKAVGSGVANLVPVWTLEWPGW
jgi:hypothetical protein